MYVFYQSRNNAKDPNGQFCYKFLRLYKMICWIRHIFSFRIHDSLLMLWESLIHDFLPSIGFLCGERRRSIQTDLVIRFHAAAQRKIISNPLYFLTHRHELFIEGNVFFPSKLFPTLLYLHQLGLQCFVLAELTKAVSDHDTTPPSLDLHLNEE